ncbi:MAG: hypothetical protein IM620_15140 [Cytophagales bacterium]|nr:hypothetical protein [Cytophagales bacterium]
MKNKFLQIMDINIERSLIIKELQQINDISLLKAIKHLVHYGLKNDGHISIEQYNKELEEAEAEIERGEFVSHEDLKKQMKEW